MSPRCAVAGLARRTVASPRSASTSTRRLQNHVATGMAGVRLVVDEFDDPAQSARPRLVTANKNDGRQQLDEQRRVRAIEAEIPAKHPHRHRTRATPVPGIARVIQG